MNMKHTHCTTCGKEKLTYNAQRRELCGSCAQKGKTASEETKAKMSEARKGKPNPWKHVPQSIEIRNATSLALGGDGNVESRKYGNLGKWTRQVIQRDGKCMTCNSTERLEAHHILAKSKWPQFATKTMNGITLCYDCHRGSSGVHKSKKKEV